MVKIVVPLGIEAVSSKLWGSDHTCIVKGTFSNDVDLSVELLPSLVYSRGELREEGISRKVQNSVNGIDSQGIDVNFGYPVQRIFNEITPNFVTVRPIEVN